MKRPDSHYMIPELHEANSQGFVHDFILHRSGLLYCLAHPSRHYEIDEFHTIAIPCAELNATLYLISTHDGICGTMIDYHEF